MLVTSVNGLKSNSTMGWIVWYINAPSSQWTLPSYSADKEILQRGDVIAWTYESCFSASTNSNITNSGFLPSSSLLFRS